MQILFYKNNYFPFAHLFFNTFQYIKYNYLFTGTHNILFVIYGSMEKLCYVICFPIYTSKIYGIISGNSIYPSNTTSPILVKKINE